MILRCEACGTRLAVPDAGRDWIEHHDDGSHTHHFEAAYVGDTVNEIASDITSGLREWIDSGDVEVGR